MNRYEGHVVRYDPATDKPVDIDKAKRGTSWYKELHPNAVAYGKIFEDRFEEALKEHGIPYTRTTGRYIKKGGDGGYDFKVGRFRIDVKVTAYTGPGEPWLKVEKGKIKAHLYVLYSPTSLLGFATWKDLKERAPEKKPLDVVNHIIPASELKSEKRLWIGLRNAVL